MSFKRLRRKQHHYFNFSKKRLSVWSEGSITTTVFISSSSKAFQALLNKRTQPTFCFFKNVLYNTGGFSAPINCNLFQCVRKSCIFNLYTSVIFIFNTSSHGQKLCSFIGLLIFKFIWRKIYSKCCARKEKKLLFWPLTRRLDILMLFYSSTVVYCTPMLTQYIPVCLN